MASVHAIMSAPKSNSCGSCAAATTRTPSAISSVDGWLLGSVPLGRRLSTTTSCPSAASAVASWYTCLPSPPITTGGYSHDTIRTFMRAHFGASVRKMHTFRGVSACRHARSRGGEVGSPWQPSCIKCAEQTVGAFPAVGQSLCVFAAARRQRAANLTGGVRVQVRAIAGVVGGGILADHERPVAGHREQRFAQDLIGDEVAGRRCVGLTERLVHSGQRGVDDFSVELDQIGDLLTRPHLPVLAGTPRAGR